MTINQNCRTSGPMFIARPHNGMTFRRYKLRSQTDSCEFVDQPVCTFHQLFLVLVVSRHAWETEKRVILLEIIIAHGEKLIGFCGLPTVSDETPTRKIENRREQQHNSGHEEFANRGVSENPNDREDRQGGHNFHSREIERLSIRAHIALHQNPARGAAEQIHQQNGDIRKERKLLECAADRQHKRQRSVCNNRDIRRSIARMHMHEKLRQCPVSTESKNHSRRTQDIASHESKCGDAGSGQNNHAAEVAKECRRRLGEWRLWVICEIGTKRSRRREVEPEVSVCYSY